MDGFNGVSAKYLNNCLIWYNFVRQTGKTDAENKLWSGRMGAPKVAICPKCGEVSIYLEDVERLRK